MEASTSESVIVVRDVEKWARRIVHVPSTDLFILLIALGLMLVQTFNVFQLENHLVTVVADPEDGRKNLVVVCCGGHQIHMVAIQIVQNPMVQVTALLINIFVLSHVNRG